MRRGFLTSVVGIATFITLLLGVGSIQPLIANNMPGMGKQMSQSQCQSSCTTQQHTIAATLYENKQEKDKEDTPQPAEPYYMAFTGAGWSLILTAFVAYILRRLCWRPPDLVKLYANYRF